MIGDKAFYYLHHYGKLPEAILTYMDYFTVAGPEDFAYKILVGVSNHITVSEVETDKFRYTGLEVEALEGGNKVSMQEYIKSLENVEVIR